MPATSGARGCQAANGSVFLESTTRMQRTHTHHTQSTRTDMCTTKCVCRCSSQRVWPLAHLVSEPTDSANTLCHMRGCKTKRCKKPLPVTVSGFGSFCLSSSTSSTPEFEEEGCQVFLWPPSLEEEGRSRKARRWWRVEGAAR